MPSFGGYVGVLVRPLTVVQTPLRRTCTVSVSNQPPSEKFMPSWKTTRLKVWTVG